MHWCTLVKNPEIDGTNSKSVKFLQEFTMLWNHASSSKPTKVNQTRDIGTKARSSRSKKDKGK
jgi:hypothetical protein